MRSLWSEHAVPRVLDVVLGTRRITELRRSALAPAHGRVLEIGYGSGLMVPLYPPAVTEILAVEPSRVARRRAAGREAASTVPVRHIGLDGQQIPADDGSVDTVVSAFTLCTVPDPAAALAEVRRVLRDDGVFLFLEHVQAPTERARTWQRRLTPVQRRLFDGCHLGRDVDDLVGRAGLVLGEVRSDSGALPPPVGPVSVGSARPPGS